MSLNFNYEGTDEHKLDFDPWSELNINGDNSIDEKNVEAITDLNERVKTFIRFKL